MRVLDRSAISRGASVGLVLFVPVSAARVLIDRNVNDFDNSGWAPLFALALFVIYGIAGYAAARMALDTPLSNGIVAAVGAFLLWIPIRIAIWILRDSGQPLFGGRDPVLTPARILGQLVFAALFGAIGGYLSMRRSKTAAPPAEAPDTSEA